MKSRRVGILVTAVVLFVDASRVLAVIEFNDGGVHDIDYEINDAECMTLTTKSTTTYGLTINRRGWELQ